MLVTIECILTDLWLWILQAPVQLVSYYATSQITIMEQVWILEVVVCQSPIKNLKYLKIKLSSIADNEVNSGKEMNKENAIKIQNHKGNILLLWLNKKRFLYHLIILLEIISFGDLT